MLIKCTGNLLLVLFCSNLAAQDSVSFRNFKLLGSSYAADKSIQLTDSFVTKKYIMLDAKGDSLFLFQKLPFRMMNGKARIFEMGLTDRFVHLRDDSTYTIIFSKDTYGLMKSSEYIKARKIDFLYKGVDGIQRSTVDSSNSLILLSVFSVPEAPVDKKLSYLNALDSLQSLIENSSDRTTFKKAVFIAENAFEGGKIPYAEFSRRIDAMTATITMWSNNNRMPPYKYSDSTNFLKNYAIYHFLKDTTFWIVDGNEFTHFPYTYNFDDYSGYTDWSNMFVTKLIVRHSGNCHSIPYLYKILADEIGATCWLSLAPNHIYIENRCKKIGWYNTELTSGSFPIDAWIMASGYLPLQAIQSGIYMDTLSNPQSIALCVLDLAKGYEHKTHNYTDGFILKCCDLSLRYFPLNVQAILLKAETLKRIYEKQQSEKAVIAKKTYHQMEQLYVKLFDLGYREMPDKMYQQWLMSVVQERDKYSNKEVKETIQGNNN